MKHTHGLIRELSARYDPAFRPNCQQQSVCVSRVYFQKNMYLKVGVAAFEKLVKIFLDALIKS